MAPCGRELLPDDLDHLLDRVGPLWEKLRGERLFLTGGTGFFGKWLLESLLAANRRLDLNCRITVLSRDPGAFLERHPHLGDPALVSFTPGDVRDFAFPDGEFKFVIHGATDVAAATSALELFSSCLDGTRRVLDFARQAGCCEFLQVSSGAVYGRQPADLAAIPEDYHGAPDPLKASSAYGEGKRCAEWLASAYGEQHRFGVKVARCFAFVGPHLPLDRQFAIGNFLGAALSGRELVIQGDGSALRSYLYAADLAVWLWTILLRAPAGSVYNVGGADALSIGELAVRISRLAGSESEVRILSPHDPGKAAERYVPDVRKAAQELGLQAWTSLDEAILRTLQWGRSGR